MAKSTLAIADAIALQRDGASAGAELARLIRRAEHYLARHDPIMRRLIAAYGPCALAERESEPFHMLASSIISQQLSTKAARAIKLRVGVLIGVPFQAARVRSVTNEDLRDAGLSGAKVSYICELATRVVDGRLELSEFNFLDDQAVIEKLVQLPGIGRWTADMFLLFGLKRLDVLALGDAGLQRAAWLLYGTRQKSTALLPRIGAKWQPYRSIASWYLWRSLEDIQKSK